MTEEVRKCVEILRYCDESGGCCGGCPSGKTNGIPNCYSISHIADLIESLSAQLDAAVRDMGMTAHCDICGHHRKNGGDCIGFSECGQHRPRWKWRGAEVE